jgi:hypothetical protein
MAALGFTAGVMTGATATAGATQALVTGVLTFVGGTVLSYGAFATKQHVQKKKAKAEGEADPPPPNVSRVGAGLVALSIAMLVGAFGGMWFRYRDPFGWAPPRSVAAEKVESAEKKTEKTDKTDKTDKTAETSGSDHVASFGFQAGPGDKNAVVVRVRQRLQSKFYDADDNIKNDVSALVDLASTCPHP